MDFEVTTNIELILSTGEYLFKGILYGFDKGRKKDPAPMKLDSTSNIYSKKYTGAEKKMLQNFMAESFTVAGVLNFRMQEKLKQLAADILKGKTGEQVSRGEEKVDPNKLFVERAKELLHQYQYDGKIAPDGHLKANFNTAVSSAYHGSLWQKTQDAGIYSALQYKTRKDSKVRDSHRSLDDKIFYIADPIWKTIYPPNGWNCRCYTTPLTVTEIVGKQIEDSQRNPEAEKTIIKDAKISKEFARNSGMTYSIFGKWLDSELEAISWTSVFKAAFENDRSVSKLIEKEQLDKILEENAAPYRYIKPTQENWDKEFPDNKVVTGLNEKIAEFKNDLKIKDKPGTFTSFEKLFEKEDGRHELMGLIKPTLQEPLFVFKDKENGIIFVKSFKGKDGRIDMVSITYSKGELLEIVSNYPISDYKQFLEKFKSGEVLLIGKDSTFKKPGSFSRDTSPGVPARFELGTKVIKPPAKFNEVWADRSYSSAEKVYKSKINYITYSPDGIEVATISGEDVKKKFLNWSELDSARKGMLIQLISP